MKKITRSIRITEENWMLLHELAKKDNRTVSNYLENVIEKHIKDQLSDNSNNK